MASSTYFAVEAAIGSVGTTVMWFAVGTTAAGAARPQKRYDALEVFINSTASTGFVRRGAAASSTGAQENVIVPKGKTSVTIAYSTRISIKASAAATAYVRGISRTLNGGNR